MSSIFDGIGVKRYVLRHRKSYVSPWEYPGDLRFDTLEEAEAALERMPRSGYGIAELWPQCQRQSEIVRKRRRNFVIFGRREGNKLKRFLAQKVCLQSAASGA